MTKLSLQEQLIQSGLVSSTQAKVIKTEKHKLHKQQQHNKTYIADVAKDQAQKAKLEQAEKDRLLNLQLQKEEERKQITAQIKQLIKQNRIPQDKIITDDSYAYHFTVGNMVKTLYVSKETREQITQGKLSIARLGKQYEVVPADIALKIKERDAQYIIASNNTDSLKNTMEDPYADYQVPDDLVW